MKKRIIIFILNILLFSMPILIFMFVAEAYLHSRLNNYNWKKYNLEKKLDSVQILILGSSHALYGIDPAEFTLHAYNLANVSQSLYYDEALFKKYYNRIPRLRYVIITVSSFSLGFELFDSPEQWREYYYFRYFDIEIQKKKFFDIKKYSFIYLLGPKIAMKALLSSQHTDVLCNSNGYYKTDRTSDLSEKNGLDRAQYHKNIYRQDWIKDNTELLCSLISEIKEHNCIPVLVQLPVTSTYQNMLPPQMVNGTTLRLDSISNHFKIPYYNFSTDMRFDSSCFFDNDHLNQKGATLISGIINHLLLSYEYK